MWASPPVCREFIFPDPTPDDLRPVAGFGPIASNGGVGAPKRRDAMKIPQNLLNLGFTKYEAQVYLALVSDSPLNGSRLSRVSGVPRANIYNVLDGLKERGILMEVEKGVYAPLPPSELLKQLQRRRDEDLSVFKAVTDALKHQDRQEYIWSITGFTKVMAKAKEMIASAEREVFVRLFPEEGTRLKKSLKEAEARGVEIKYVSFGPVPVTFDCQVVHPEIETLTRLMDGRSINIVVDYREAIAGVLETGPEKLSRVAWAKNHSLAFATREALRHDFYHVFLYKLHELGEPLSEHEKKLYQVIKTDLSKTYNYRSF